MKASMLPLLLSAGCLMEVTVGTRVPKDEDPVVAPEDLDDDGFTVGEGDCDDNDPDAGPAGWGSEFAEKCDGIDNDCDGAVDDGCNREDLFPQRLQLDALFVIDTSDSMQPHIARAADGAADFLQHLVGQPFDTHIGVVTMDSSQPDALGRLVTVDGRQFLEGNDPKFGGEAARQWLTKALTENGTLTGAAPTGRAAVDAALVRDDESDWNQGFLRYSGSLQIIFISNHQDASVTPSQTGFLDDLELVKGSLSNVAIHAITQLDDLDCEGQESADTRGTSYVSLAGSTFIGTTLSICEAEYGTGLSVIGQYAALEGLESEFTLSRAAQPDSVEVTLNLLGVYDHYELGPDEFTLAGGQTLILRGDPPPAGTIITVAYVVQD